MTKGIGEMFLGATCQCLFEYKKTTYVNKLVTSSHKSFFVIYYL